MVIIVGEDSTGAEEKAARKQTCKEGSSFHPTAPFWDRGEEGAVRAYSSSLAFNDPDTSKPVSLFFAEPMRAQYSRVARGEPTRTCLAAITGNRSRG